MKKLLLLIVTCTYMFSVNAQSTFNITKTGTTTQIDSAIDYAGSLWSQYLNSTVPIKVNVIYTALPGSTLGRTIPNGEKDFSGAPVANVWYFSCLANSIASTELNPGEFDMDIYMNSSSNFYFGTDGNPSGQFDFVSVLMHEIMHGLGGGSLAYIKSGMGSFGTLDSTDLFPIIPSWGFGDTLGGLPSIWDKFLVNGSGMDISDTLLFPNVSIALASELQSDNIFFSGANATAANGGNQPKMYAPSVYTQGSSIHHFDEATYPYASGDAFFTPNSNVNEVHHAPSGMALGTLVDIGWSVNLNVGIEEQLFSTVNIYPNPTTGKLSIFLEEASTGVLSIRNYLGQLIKQEEFNNTQKLNISLDEPSGIYFLQLEIDGKLLTKKIIKE